MTNDNVTFCNGISCGIREFCHRYVEGQRIKANIHGDSDQHRWWDECDGDYRDGFIFAK